MLRLSLPEGILQFRVKEELRRLWNWDRVVVISQFEPKLPWSVHNAMTRNFVICGLSRAMILIEAGTIGGSIAAGRACLDMGRPLFAPVYEGMPEAAAGNRVLLKEGARPLLKNRQTQRAAIQRVLEALVSDESCTSEPQQIPLFA